MGRNDLPKDSDQQEADTKNYSVLAQHWDQTVEVDEAQLGKNRTITTAQSNISAMSGGEMGGATCSQAAGNPRSRAAAPPKAGVSVASKPVGSPMGK